MLISHASKIMFKILQARLQQYVNPEIPDVQTGFRKGRGNRNQIANISWIIKKAREFQRTICFHFIDYVKAFDCGSQKTGKFFKRQKYQAALLVSWETCMQLKKQQLESDMERWTGSKLGKEYDKAIYYHPAYLTYICRVHNMKFWTRWITSGKRLLGEISTTSDM